MKELLLIVIAGFLPILAPVKLEAAQVGPDYLGKALINELKQFGSAEKAIKLIEQGADINAQDYKGHSALILSIWRPRPYLNVINELLKGGAQVDLAGPDGKTPLMIAAMKGNSAIVELLLKNGADPLAVDRTGESVLNYALKYPAIYKMIQEQQDVEKEILGSLPSDLEGNIRGFLRR